MLTAVGSSNIDALPPDEIAADWYRAHSDVLAPIADAAHEYGALIGMQLQHRGAQGGPPGQPRWAPSTVPLQGTFGHWGENEGLPQELTSAQIEVIIQRYGLAAGHLSQAGFDIIEIQAAHGYLVTEFLSPRTNLRSDQWGGSEGGLRFLQAVIGQVRSAASAQVALSVRVSASERFAGGLGVADTAHILQSLPPGSVDLANVSGGIYGSDPGIVATYASPYGYNTVDAGDLRSRLSVPVATAGRIWDPMQMARLVEAGKTDIIGLGRQLWADPELPNKIRSGALGTIRPAIGCNQGCIDRADGDIRTCLVNPILGIEAKPGTSAAAIHARRVAVIGGGVAGIEAARSAAWRGHNVTLYERSWELGGRWRLASRMPAKAEYQRYLAWQVQDLQASGATVVLGQSVDLQRLPTEGFDAVVVATGATFHPAEIPGRPCVTPDSAIAQSWLVGARVLVVGADQLHAEAATYLALSGRAVTLATEGREVAFDCGPTAKASVTKALLGSGVRIEPHSRPGLTAANGSRENEDARKLLNAADTVVSLGHYELPNETGIATMTAPPEIHIIGDAKSVRSGLEAISDGSRIGSGI
jgi:2,4-dienoyl-CoA reductase-like NADH-dependent reductase (Old Yellow Enzyme family)